MNFPAKSSRPPLVYISSINPCVSPWSYSSRVPLKSSSFQSCFSASRHPPFSSLFVGTAKVRIFFSMTSFFFFIFSEYLNPSKSLKNPQQILLSHAFQKSNSFILFTHPLPPKRDAKVGKITTHTKYCQL